MVQLSNLKLLVHPYEGYVLLVVLVQRLFGLLSLLLDYFVLRDGSSYEFGHRFLSINVNKIS